jgi:hypothetical protein
MTFARSGQVVAIMYIRPCASARWASPQVTEQELRPLHGYLRSNAAHTVRLSVCALVVSAFLMAARTAWAQDAAPQAGADLARLSQKLKVGESVVVTTDDGREARGRFLDVSATAFTLHVDNVRQRIPANQVNRVQVRRNGVLLGALIGAGTGVPFGLALRSYARNEAGSEAGALAFPIAVGLGIGIAIDALLVKPRTVFNRGYSARSVLFPIVASKRAGVGVAITF